MKVELIESMGSDLTVVNAARVSFDKQSKFIDGKLQDKDIRLIKYLADHKHTSPFGHCFASFRIKAPIFVARQLQKHAYLRMNEVSRRYVDTSPEFYVPKVWRGRPVDKKQGSSGEHPTFNRGKGTGYVDYYTDTLSTCLETYEFMIKEGVAPEQARMVLPQSMYTEWYWSGSLDAFANMYNLRAKPDAQEETRFIATEIGRHMEKKFPISWKALTNGV